jgi:maltoporin|nr:carbohydrate porin [Kofleriaceae bacterium]
MRAALIVGVLMAIAPIATAQPTAPDGAGSDAGSAAAPTAATEAAPPPPAAVVPVVVVEPVPAQQPAAAGSATGSGTQFATKPPDQRVQTTDLVSLGSDTGFRFGSYGRVTAGDDLRGGAPEKILVGEVGPRTVEDNYLELDMSYGFVTQRGVKLRPVVTLALEGTLFHDTGVFDAQPAIRNLFLDAQVNEHVTLWVGSRMYRGDDIYLFDYWPLDNQNTVGAGAFYHTHSKPSDSIDLAIHAGVNRLNNPLCATAPTIGNCFEFQQVAVANPEQGEAIVEQVNRQHLVASATASYLTDTNPAHLDLKLKVHGELHGLPSATFLRDDGSLQPLPSDTGYLIGAEVGMFGLAPASAGYRRHLNLFARYAKGIAAFDPLAAPSSFGPDLKTTRASELSFGASGNWDSERGNLMIAALSRRFIDATGQGNFNDGWEYAIDARPLARFAPDWFAGADISYEARFPRGINPFTERAEDPAVFQVAPMVVFSPMGPSAYDRPQLRFVYRGAYLNQGALDLYVPGDIRHGREWEHFLGVEAEWWFNSSTYR